MFGFRNVNNLYREKKTQPRNPYSLDDGIPHIRIHA